MHEGMLANQIAPATIASDITGWQDYKILGRGAMERQL